MYQPSKKPVHLVKNYDKVPEKQRHAEPLYAQEKIDGVYAYGLCVLGDNRIFSRTGEQCLSLQHLEKELEDLAVSRKFQPFVAIFEVHVHGWPVNKISGAFRRQSVQFTEAVARIHDVIPYDDFVAGLCELPYRLRYVAADFASQCMESFTIIEAFDVETAEDVRSFADKHINAGGEGGVFKRQNGIWIAGKRDVNMMKIKVGVSYDLEVVGMEEGKGKYEGNLGKLVCAWTRNRMVRVSGMVDTDRIKWWTDPTLIIGKIVKVDGMCLTPDGMIREPRFKEVRRDKLEADV